MCRKVASKALSADWAKIGIDFMQEMMQIASQLEKQDTGRGKTEGVVEILSQPYFGTARYKVSPAQFGPDLSMEQAESTAILAVPFRSCRPLLNSKEIEGHIAIIQRQDCLFQEKARFAQQAGAIGAIIVDNVFGTSVENSLPFAMSGDSSVEDDIKIPVVFLFYKEGEQLIEQIKRSPASVIRISGPCVKPVFIFEQFLVRGHYASRNSNTLSRCQEDFIDVKEPLVFDASIPLIVFNFRFGDADHSNDLILKQKAVDMNVANMESLYTLKTPTESLVFFNYVRKVGYSQLGLSAALTQVELGEMMSRLGELSKSGNSKVHLTGSVTRIICRSADMSFICYRLYL